MRRGRKEDHPGHRRSFQLVGDLNQSQRASLENLVAGAVAWGADAPRLEAFPAENRLVIARLKGNLGFLAAIRANGRVHLAWSAVVVAPA